MGEVRDLLYTTILLYLTILQATHVELSRVRDHLRADQCRSNGASTVETFAETPLTLTELLCSARDVVGSCVAQYIIQGFGFRDILARFADHNSQLRFPVCFVVLQGEFGNDSWCRIWVGECCLRLPEAICQTMISTGCTAWYGLQEQYRLTWIGKVHLIGVLTILCFVS